MKPVFPSKTFPNHYSIVTGLYPSWHGVVANSFYEPNLDEHFTMRNKNPDMWLGEPLWQSAVREGMNAATFFWPGAEVQKNGWTCPRKYCPRYDGSVPYSERVDAVLRWLDEPVDTRPQFLTLYFEEPDHTGHEKGPDSADVAEARGLLDGDDAIHVIHVGDHGMAGVGGECRYVPVDEIAPNFNASWFEAAHVGYGHLGGNAPLLRVRPPTAKDADVAYTQLAGAMHVANARVRVYKESQLAGAPFPLLECT